MGPVALRARVPALLFGVLRVRRFLYVHHHSRVRVPCFCFPSDVCCRPYRMPRSRRKVSSDDESSATTSSSDSGDASFESDQDGRNKRRRRRKTPRKTGHRHKKRIKKESAGKFRRRSKQQSPPASSPSPEERGKKTLHLVGACPFSCWVARKRAMEKKSSMEQKKVPRWVAGWQHHLPVPAAAQQTRGRGLGQPAVQGRIAHGRCSGGREPVPDRAAVLRGLPARPRVHEVDVHDGHVRDRQRGLSAPGQLQEGDPPSHGAMWVPSHSYNYP